MGETLRTTPHMPAHGFSLTVNLQNEKRTIDIGTTKWHGIFAAEGARSGSQQSAAQRPPHGRWSEAPKGRLGGWFGRGVALDPLP